MRASSPRLWGCFRVMNEDEERQYVFPTPVGVFPLGSSSYVACRCLPHACGGVSVQCVTPVCLQVSSPRLWGCFSRIVSYSNYFSVFPTPVGVFLIMWCIKLTNHSLPHACGGVSIYAPTIRSILLSSPRLWGCFQTALDRQATAGVFPTPVGVFPDGTGQRNWLGCLPHACGGVSSSIHAFAGRAMSSPRLWGCFFSGVNFFPCFAVFPTPVGVFPPAVHTGSAASGLPHACGGVSWKEDKEKVDRWSSPRLWGCFLE